MALAVASCATACSPGSTTCGAIRVQRLRRLHRAEPRARDRRVRSRAELRDSFGASNGVSATAHHPIRRRASSSRPASRVDGRLGASLAFFDLTRENLLTPDLTTPDPDDSIAVGEQSTEGIELDVSGEVADGLQVIGSYSYFAKRKVTKGDSGLEGNRLPNVPRHAGSVWVRYDVALPPLEGLSAGFGVFALGDRRGDADNTFVLPGYTRVDALAAYGFEVAGSRVTAQLNLRNLFDETYFQKRGHGIWGTLIPRLGAKRGVGSQR